MCFRCSDGTLEGGRSLSSSLFSSVGDETLTLQAAGSQAADTDDDGTALVSSITLPSELLSKLLLPSVYLPSVYGNPDLFPSGPRRR